MAKKKENENPLASVVETVTETVGHMAETVGDAVGSAAGTVAEKVTSVVGGSEGKPKKATKARAATKPKPMSKPKPTTKTKTTATAKKEKGDGGDRTEAPNVTAGATELPEHLSRRRIEIGRVVSDKMQLTVTVLVQRSKPHPIYKKVMRRSVKFMAHDEMGAGMGDTVRIMESRPMSKHKRWRVIEIVQRAE